MCERVGVCVCVWNRWQARMVDMHNDYTALNPKDTIAYHMNVLSAWLFCQKRWISRVSHVASAVIDSLHGCPGTECQPSVMELS